MPRLGYRKSRTGCVRCKQRRVKCDEEVPCAACVRHSVRCSLLSSPPRPRQTPPGKPSSKQCESPWNSRLNSWVSLKPINPGASSRPLRVLAPAPASSSTSSSTAEHVGLLHDYTASSQGQLDLDSLLFFADALTDHRPETTSTWITDLELMHHYTSSTYRTLPRTSEQYSVWQTDIPRMALQHLFLMHQVLAISAFHLAHLHPEQGNHYSLLASQHQSHAVKGIRDAVTQITEDSCHAIFTAASMLTLNAFANFSIHRPHLDSHLSSSFDVDNISSSTSRIDDLLEVFVLIRGMNEILMTWHENIKTGPLSHLLQLPTTVSKVPVLDSFVDRLNHLILPDEAGLEQRVLCYKEVSSLLKCIEHALSSTSLPLLRITMAWPIGIDDKFINLIRTRQPAALIVLCYYCLILHSAGSQHWFFCGWGSDVLNEIASVLGPGSAADLEWQMSWLDTPPGHVQGV